MLGGVQGTEIHANKTFVFDTYNKNKGWRGGPELVFGRCLHSCGKIKAKEDGDIFSIIVVGGFNVDSPTTRIASVGILDDSLYKWQAGPMLPRGVSLSQLVELPDGGIILVGGKQDKANTGLKSIFYLSHSEANWTELTQTLTLGRNCHVAFFVPDGITNCH